MNMVYWVGVVFAVWLTVPWLTLVHELGHAVSVLGFTSEWVTIEVGTRPWWTLRLGKLTIKMNPVRSGLFGFYRLRLAPIPRWQRIFIHLCGPCATASLLCVFIVVSWRVAIVWQPVVNALAIVSLSQLLCTLVPIRYPRWWGSYAGWESDGLRVWRLYSK